MNFLHLIGAVHYKIFLQEVINSKDLQNFFEFLNNQLN